MQKFKKFYTRDQSLLMASAWCHANYAGVKLWSKSPQPHTPPIILHADSGLEETWHNLKAYQWIKDSVQDNIDRLPEIVPKYKNLLKQLADFSGNAPLTPTKAIEDYLDLVLSTSPYQAFCYYAATDDRTPKKFQDQALQLREEDTFFDNCDKTIRDSIVRIYPETQGYEGFILPDELESPNLDLAKQRYKNFVYAPEFIKEISTLGEFSKKHPDYHFEQEYSPDMLDTAAVKGQVACQGTAKGRVKVIRLIREIDTVAQNDILIAPMTTVNYLPAMKKAAAFVTDEGGLTSHAAIVARELNKPCVVGTKFATKVFKDGDYVEVDATKGIVKKIK